MKFLNLSDLHLVYENPICRKDNLFEVQFDKLEFILKYAKKNDLVILQAGDFFDKHRNWYLLSRTVELLNKYQVQILTVKGQHDQYYRSEEASKATNFGIIANHHFFKDISNSSINFGDVTVYGVGWNQIPNLKPNKKTKNILLVHASIYTQPLFNGHKYLDAAGYLKKYSKYQFILCGDIHRRFLLKYNDRYILNTGPVLRKEAEEYLLDYKPCFYVYDTNKNSLEKVEIPCQDSLEVISRKHIERAKERIDSKSFIENVKSVKLVNKKPQQIITEFCKKNKIEKEVTDHIMKTIPEVEK